MSPFSTLSTFGKPKRDMTRYKGDLLFVPFLSAWANLASQKETWRDMKDICCLSLCLVLEHASWSYIDQLLMNSFQYAWAISSSTLDKQIEAWWWGVSLYLCQIHGQCAWALSMRYEHGACFCPLSTSMPHVTIDTMHIWQTNIDMAEYGACLSHQIVREDAPCRRDRHKNSTFYLICRFPAPLWLLFLEGFSSVKLVSHGY